MITMIWNSIRKPSAYKQMTQTHLGRVIGTLLIFFILVTFASGWGMIVGTNQFVAFMQNEYQTKMPNFTFDGTQLKAEQASPVVLSDNRDFTVILDTVSDTSAESLRLVTNGAVLGKNEMVLVAGGVEQSLTYRQLQLPALTKGDVGQVAPMLKPIMLIMLAIWFFVVLVWKFIGIFFFSFFSMFFASMQRVRLTYRQAWLIAAFAFIPASLIQMLNVTLQSVYLNYAFWVAIVTYIYHGVRSFKEDPEGTL